MGSMGSTLFALSSILIQVWTVTSDEKQRQNGEKVNNIFHALSIQFECSCLFLFIHACLFGLSLWPI